MSGPGLACDHVHHRGLAGAVRPDDGPKLARVDHQRELIERAEAIEADGDAIEIEQRSVITEASGILCPYAALRFAIRGRPGARQAQARKRADDALGQEYGHHDEQAAQHEQPELRRRRRGVALGVVDQDRADQRPTSVPRPPTATQIAISIEFAGENSDGLMIPTWGT